MRVITATDKSYLSCFYDDEDDLFLLARSALEIRNADTRILPGRNIGSTLLVRGEERFPPAPAASQGPGGHSELLSFAEIIKLAIKRKWGPFANFPEEANKKLQEKLKQKHPQKLSCADVKAIPELQQALAQIDAIKVFSERAICDNAYDGNEYSPCLRFFNELDQVLRKGNLYLFQAIPKYSENGRYMTGEQNITHICDAVTALKRESIQRLIGERYDIIQEKKALQMKYQEQLDACSKLYPSQGDYELHLADIESNHSKEMKALKARESNNIVQMRAELTTKKLDTDRSAVVVLPSPSPGSGPSREPGSSSDIHPFSSRIKRPLPTSYQPSTKRKKSDALSDSFASTKEIQATKFVTLQEAFKRGSDTGTGLSSKGSGSPLLTKHETTPASGPNLDSKSPAVTPEDNQEIPPSKIKNQDSHEGREKPKPK